MHPHQFRPNLGQITVFSIITFFALGAIVSYMLATDIVAAAIRSTPVFINEIHYDNEGGDVDEAIEIAAPAGTDLDGWLLVLYNGSNGTSYGTIELTGVVDDEGSGFGALSFPAPASGLQNGAPDGVALVDDSGMVVEFISYEGAFAATAGPAVGQASTDIGVAETTSTAAGESLQRVGGPGGSADAFSWSGPATASMGQLNVGQTAVAVPLADIAVAISGPDSADSGMPINYILTVTNQGNALAQSVLLTQTLPSDFSYVTFDSIPVGIPAGVGTDTIVWDVGDLAPAETATIDLRLLIAASASGSYTLPLAADTLSDENDLANNVTAHLTTVGVQLFVSQEITPTQGGSRDAAEALVATLDDEWRQQAAGIGATCAASATFAGVEAANPLAVSAGPITVTVANHNMTALTTVTDFGELGGPVSLRTGDALQDNSPRPIALADGALHPYWSESSGSSSSRNGAVVSVAEGVPALGMWIGDVETRSDGRGTAAELRVGLCNGVVLTSPIEPTVVDQSRCGAPDDDNFEGCGNSTTRWVGATAPAGVNICSIVVIVGDDDDERSTNDGNSEHSSLIAPTVAYRPNPDSSRCVQTTAINLQLSEAQRQMVMPKPIATVFVTLLLVTSIVGYWQLDSVYSQNKMR